MYYDDYMLENAILAEELNKNITDICEQMEPGMESVKFHRELSAEVDRWLALLDE